MQGDNATKAPKPKHTKAREHKVLKVTATTRVQERQRARTERGKGMVRRRDGTAVRRVVAYLAADVGKRLVVYCAERGEDLSAAVEAAVVRFLDGKSGRA